MLFETLGAIYVITSTFAIFFAVWKLLIHKEPEPPEVKLICPDCSKDLKFKYSSFKCSCGVKIKVKKL